MNLEMGLDWAHHEETNLQHDQTGLIVLIWLDQRKQIIEAVFLSVLDYDDATYRHVCASTLKPLDSVDHSAQRFITGDSYSGNSLANRW